MSLAPGIYTEAQISMSAYLADPCPAPSLSSGIAHTLLTRSPAHAWADHPRLGGAVSESGASADVGSLAHAMLFGGNALVCVIDPELYRSKPTKADPEGSVPVGWTNAAIRAARDEARANGFVPILLAQFNGVKRMVEAAKAYLKACSPELLLALCRGAAESTLIWREGDVWLRARPDWLAHYADGAGGADGGLLLHYKTTEASARPEAFCRGPMTAMGYDLAMAFYRRGFEACGGSRDAKHLMLVQEQHAPYACSLVTLDPARWAVCDTKIEAAVRLWAECMRSDSWPAYPTVPYEASPTPWQLAEAEELSLLQGH